MTHLITKCVHISLYVSMTLKERKFDTNPIKKRGTTSVHLQDSALYTLLLDYFAITSTFIELGSIKL